jgi:hypothetical protein
MMSSWIDLDGLNPSPSCCANWSARDLRSTDDHARACSYIFKAFVQFSFIKILNKIIYYYFNYFEILIIYIILYYNYKFIKFLSFYDINIFY